jgi:DNA polymerase III subunit chi
VSEVLFYHLTERPLEAVLPEILERALQRHWRVGVQGTDRGRLAMLDAHLWTFRDDGFLPHGLAGEAHERDQPILLSAGAEFANQPQVLLLVDGVRRAAAELVGFERVCILFDGNDPDRLFDARADWKAVSDAGLRAVYWAQEAGKWVKKAESGPQPG